MPSFSPPPIPDATRERLRALPKAHLHVHLEHTLRRATFRALASREGVSLDGFWDFDSLATFLGRGEPLSRCIASPADLERMCWEFVEDEARDGVLYVEPMIVVGRWVPDLGSREEVFALERDALQAAGRRYGVEVGILVGFPRHRTTGDQALDLARWAAGYAGDGVVAFGFAGDEFAHRMEDYAPACALARAAGLLVVPHAGEVGGPESVRATLDAIQPDRIAHGVNAAADVTLLARLASEGVTCDVCPTSNVLLGVAPSLAAHPLPALLAAGVPVTLNADDPTEFDVSALDEYCRAQVTFGLRDDTMAAIAATSARASGASEATKRRMLDGIAAWRTRTAPTHPIHDSRTTDA